MMETADEGTLFLDEVNEMGLSCQAKLLRAVERREFRRVGGTRKLKVDIRVIGASNASLEEWVAAKRFRADLYYRLKVLLDHGPAAARAAGGDPPAGRALPRGHREGGEARAQAADARPRCGSSSATTGPATCAS